MPLPVEAIPVAFILTRDRAASLPFYRDVLGLALVQEGDASADFDARGLDLRLVTIPDHAPSPHPVLTWRVADIETASRALADEGVRFSQYSGMTEGDFGIWTSDDGKTRLNWFPDPDGNVLGLAQED
jgi:catechol 2,3-dioxygenase-like lactoylglutathione lyase family enzyme